jgi:hypothetical protein
MGVSVILGIALILVCCLVVVGFRAFVGVVTLLGHSFSWLYEAAVNALMRLV